MAPALTESAPTPAHTLASTQPLSKALFPDGLKTSGQHHPIYSLLQPYERFPKQVSGPTLWQAEDYHNNPERWVHVFSDEEIAELGAAADAFIASGTPLTGMAKSLFPLPKLEPFFNSVRKEVINGKGFVLFKGVPVQEWGLHKSAVAYLGFGSYFGFVDSSPDRGRRIDSPSLVGNCSPRKVHADQRIFQVLRKPEWSRSCFRPCKWYGLKPPTQRHVLILVPQVKDLGEDPTQKDRVRIYRTNAK